MKTEGCTLCYGDGWITDSKLEYDLCTPHEQGRFLERIGNLSGVMDGRMVCPRCQPNWRLAPPPPPVLHRRVGIVSRIRRFFAS